MRNDSWMKLRIGDFVVYPEDPYHVAVVESIVWPQGVKIKWLDHGWIEYAYPTDLHRLTPKEIEERLS